MNQQQSWNSHGRHYDDRDGYDDRRNRPDYGQRGNETGRRSGAGYRDDNTGYGDRYAGGGRDGYRRDDYGRDDRGRDQQASYGGGQQRFGYERTHEQYESGYGGYAGGEDQRRYSGDQGSRYDGRSGRGRNEERYGNAGYQDRPYGHSDEPEDYVDYNRGRYPLDDRRGDHFGDNAYQERRGGNRRYDDRY